MRPLELLLLCDYQTDIAATVRDHIEAFERFSRHRFHRVSMLGNIPERIDLARFDGVVIHYTLVASMDAYLSAAARARLKAFTGLKAMFIQDEYRFIDRTIAAMRDIGIDLLFTCVPESEIDKVYAPEALPGVVKVNVLTGYVPPELANRPATPTARRPIDIGYRGRKIPAYLGRLGQEKWQIGVRVAEDAPAYGLRTDISFREEDRLYGDAWIDFVSRCKAMLGAESGASVFDFSGEIERKVRRHVALHPDTSYDELEREFFPGLEGKIKLNQISPRSFEAAALRTLMILYEGEYSGILVPWRHYVPLKKDHSNMAEVVAVLRDADHLGEITERAYREIALNPRYSFAEAVADVDTAIERVFRPDMASAAQPYGAAELRLAVLLHFETYRRKLQRAVMMGVYRLIFRVLLGWTSPQRRDWIQRRLRKAYNILTRYEQRAARREASQSDAGCSETEMSATAHEIVDAPPHPPAARVPPSPPLGAERVGVRWGDVEPQPPAERISQ